MHVDEMGYLALPRPGLMVAMATGPFQAALTKCQFYGDD